MRWFKKILRDEEAATVVEYSVMLALIIAALMGAISTVGSEADATWDSIETNIATTFETAGVGN